MSKTDLDGAPVLANIEFIDLLGVGGMSRVYKARHTLTDRLIAVKVLSSQTTKTEEQLKRFQIEAKLTCNLSHPNIIQVMNYGIASDGQAYLVMEYIEGKALTELIKTESPLSYRKFQSIFVPLLSALQYAHEMGVIHRDIKPSNIIVSADSEARITAKLIDFGIAKALEEPAGQGLTKTGVVIGSPVYMSPEQCQGLQLDAKSDLYSLACVMYESLNGAPPFQSDSSFEVMYKHISEARISTKELSAQMEIPEILAKEILRGLNKDKAKRPESAKNYADSLARSLDEITLDRSPRRIAKRNSVARAVTPKIITAVGVLFLFLVLGVVLGILNQRHEQGQSSPIASKTSAESYLDKADKLSQSLGSEDVALQLCEKAITNAKKGSRTTLASAYQTASRIIMQIKDSRKQNALLPKCSTYARNASQLFNSLSMQRDYMSSNETYIKAEIQQGKFDEALSFLSTIRNDGGHNSIWLTRKKLEIIGAADNRLKDVERIALEFLTQNKDVDRTYDYYMIWSYYAGSLRRKGNVKEALHQEALIADDLVKSQTVLLAEKSTLAEGLRLLRTEKPAEFLRVFKDDLVRNASAYAESPIAEYHMQKTIGEAYIALGKNDLAESHFLKVLQKMNRTNEPIYLTRQTRSECLQHLIKLTKDDPNAVKSYQDELDKLKQ